jgi:DnaJ-class molecular chaperone
MIRTTLRNQPQASSVPVWRSHHGGRDVITTSTCTECDGTGGWDDLPNGCFGCGGTGQAPGVACSMCDGDGWTVKGHVTLRSTPTQVCPNCDGTGRQPT